MGNTSTLETKETGDSPWKFSGGTVELRSNGSPVSAFWSTYSNGSLFVWLERCLLKSTLYSHGKCPIERVVFFPSEKSDISKELGEVSVRKCVPDVERSGRRNNYLIIHAKCRGECAFYAEKGSGVWHLKSRRSNKSSSERWLTKLRWEKNAKADLRFRFHCFLFLPLTFRHRSDLDRIYVDYSSIDAIVLMEISRPVFLTVF